MLRLYLPFNLKRGRLTDAERAAYAGPFPPPKRSIMRVFPREIIRGRGWLREVEANLPKLAAKPALIVWPDSDPGFGDAELGGLAGAVSGGTDRHPRRGPASSSTRTRPTMWPPRSWRGGRTPGLDQA